MSDKFDFKEFVISILKRYKIFILLMLAFAIIFGSLGYIFSINQSTLPKQTDDMTSYILVKPKSLYSQQGDYIADRVVYDTISLIDSELFLKNAYQRFVESMPNEFESKYNIDKETFYFTDYNSLVTVERIASSPVLKINVHKYDSEFANFLAKHYYLSVSSDLSYYNEDVELSFDLYKQPENTSSNSQNNFSLNKVIKYIILGLALGFVFSILVIMLYDVFDSSIRYKSDFRKFKLDVLGEIRSEK